MRNMSKKETMTVQELEDLYKKYVHGFSEVYWLPENAIINCWWESFLLGAVSRKEMLVVAFADFLQDVDMNEDFKYSEEQVQEINSDPMCKKFRRVYCKKDKKKA